MLIFEIFKSMEGNRSWVRRWGDKNLGYRSNSDQTRTYHKISPSVGRVQPGRIFTRLYL